MFHVKMFRRRRSGRRIVNGSVFDSHSEECFFLFPRSGKKEKLNDKIHYSKCLKFWAVLRERSVLTLDYFCLPCCMWDTYVCGMRKATRKRKLKMLFNIFKGLFPHFKKGKYFCNMLTTKHTLLLFFATKILNS